MTELNALMNPQQRERVKQWREHNKGFVTSPKADALKALEEMIELCIACGATQEDIEQAFLMEIAKAQDKKEITGRFVRDKAIEEVADVLICMSVLSDNHNIDSQPVVDTKIHILYQREWTPDETGVLRRARPVKQDN